MTKSLLTAHQTGFLDFVGSCPQLYGNFYFSGGTALSEFYLQLGKNLVKVTAFLDDPILLKEIDRGAVEDYFLQLARGLDIVR